MSVDNNTKFLNSNFDLEDNEVGNEFIDFVEDEDLLASDPVEVIVARVLFALLVSVSLVINLLLALAVGRRWKTVHLIYILAASMALPDLVFYSKLVAELVNSWERSVPPWTTSGTDLYNCIRRQRVFGHLCLFVKVIFGGFKRPKWVKC